ncbi:glutamine--tRNA ligase [bacterium (Candidatus Blackallbacteria) CG17_big_fil_post_rev_8_21_14_2_50_48_46]|uniref:Glutamine--tRNA ligase n=1 Tax=bacterium (Candidatus Blackallbacteria) CG17_big_fil_post_rev_8_21_14_2_50_48_46 TaxID=2014261 RepID=A0A2M7FY17_9BACT|nr:MAG: glutamine--tRNA ligase [bacterium (Candidatus Blackallbacteria) CG18_big_fil_WC_8_21_14_2_50_49_26]PIW14009.1 MAG: glutamine--tRNA ligase [bacterium (Candidatus Blackallbacteria) CG17_big_fil_post_rev_8_21_14_2_50_48_46]PIW46861.1 MAG: glutamine--tRNA ligase [bacterium (Candidatus Blackallbacteria) CG13_big_fil_rev_8_21_14_2_50_49_14]
MSENELPSHFIQDIINADLASGKHQTVITRFPPEPNGYLHIGHAKSIWLNFGLAQKNGGRCHLRFDDTNPAKEEVEYVESIQKDIRWLGYDWDSHLYFASDYFQKLYEFAVDLIRSGKAYVDDLTPEQIREYRGTLTEPGKNSPWRERPVEESLDLFERMKAGEFEEGSRILRAKIDMTHPNMNLRDPAIYRIKKTHHHRTGDDWYIYPMYDFAHGLSDALEGITHSICTLEFEDHRPLYDWFLDQLDVPCHPQQIEFARLNITRTIMSKRYLLRLVQENHVSGWDDPRMPTLSGMRRRGFPPEAIRTLCERAGVAKSNSMVDIAMLESFVREALNQTSLRRMVVMDPVKVVLTNYPEGQVETFEAENNPENPEAGTRPIQFSRELYIERTDFMEDPPKKFFRLAPGQEVRLKHAYYITCQEVIKDAQGQITELRCTYAPDSRGGWTEDGRKVKGTLHWVNAQDAIEAEVRLYDYLFKENPDSDADFADQLNPDSLKVVSALVEPALKSAQAGQQFQFLRTGYFCLDSDSSETKLVFNRTIGLVDSWAKMQKNQGSPS